MEPATTPIVYIQSIVIGIYQKMDDVYVSGVGKEAVFTKVPGEWFITLAGNMSIGIGHEKPDLNINDVVIVTIEKLNAQPRQASKQ